jgi:hypothetical protein
VVQSQNLPVLLRAYGKSVDHVSYMVAAVGAVCLMFLFGIGWKDIRKKESTVQEAQGIESCIVVNREPKPV